MIFIQDLDFIHLYTSPLNIQRYKKSFNVLFLSLRERFISVIYISLHFLFFSLSRYILGL